MATMTEHPIYAARTRQGLTQRELGRMAGVDNTVISRLESRERGASIDTYRRLGSALGIDWRLLVEDEN